MVVINKTAARRYSPLDGPPRKEGDKEDVLI
jgi:hypothetical protein